MMATYACTLWAFDLVVKDLVTSNGFGRQFLISDPRTDVSVSKKNDHARN
jgi:hypothetical protein